ncbi:MAG: hypothetical protein EAZ99_17345 [Alphaproteobacteria bacterium]|nr:hypothetical protein [Alphaproteobacteria bacterium]TAD87494.1 MAG: hypothetical protein EAZ99_17345 [Alphaproteobacteria bacterium]
MHKHPGPAGQPRRLAFALGGLAGANAFGAGFLTAARESGVEPDMISCTSGMIHWTWRYLVGANLRTEVDQAIREAHGTAPMGRETAWGHVMAKGLSGVFRTATTEYWQRLMAFPPPLTAREWMTRLLPAQVWVPTRPESVFEEMSEVFNAWDKPLFFNSYAPKRGVELVHMNRAAYDLWCRYGYPEHNTDEDLAETGARTKNKQLPMALPKKITAKMIKDALWLTRYGFQQQKRIDGAYVRQFMLNELVAADLILLARPRRFEWKGDLPETALELQDFETKLWFDSSYMQQVHYIDFINRAVANGSLTSELYHPVQLYPIEVKLKRGFFDYFKEERGMFDAAVEQSMKAMWQELGLDQHATDPGDAVALDLSA